MNDYEVKDKPLQRRYSPTKLPGASEQLARDIQDAIAEGVSYGVYMGRKRDREDEAYFNKYGRRRKRK